MSAELKSMLYQKYCFLSNCNLLPYIETLQTEGHEAMKHLSTGTHFLKSMYGINVKL